jgi:hypothetical protein
MIAPDAREARAKKLGRIATPVRCKTYSNVPLQVGFFFLVSVAYPGGFVGYLGGRARWRPEAAP